MVISKKQVAHFILEKLLADSIKEFGSPYIIGSSGKIKAYRSGVPHEFDESNIRLQYVLEKSNYSLKQVSEAVNLLTANNHIEIIGQFGDKFEDTLIKATSAGILAYQDRFYKKFNYEKWTFWIQVVIGTAIALTIAILSTDKK